MVRRSGMLASLITAFTRFHAVVRHHFHMRSFGSKSAPPRSCTRVIMVSNRCGTGIVRYTPGFLCLRVSRTIVEFPISMRSRARANNSDMRAPVNASVRQKVAIYPRCRYAARQNASRSRAVRYLRMPCLSNNEPGMNASLPVAKIFASGCD